MKAKILLRDFGFRFVGSGHYHVTYYSPKTDKFWTALITDMSLIDATKNADEPKKKDLEHLKKVVKRNNFLTK